MTNSLSLYAYDKATGTGRFIRQLSTKESVLYVSLCDTDPRIDKRVWDVAGKPFGVKGRVYARGFSGYDRFQTQA
jgi:hypothetical protein